MTKPGYDAESRLYLHGGPFAPIGDDPKEGLELLLDALREFPFVEPYHRSAALAMLLTTASRSALASAPMFGVSAREAGTGKGALVQLAAIMATGRRAPENPWPSGGEEQRKLITATLSAASPILLLDNITEILDSAPLCVLLTAERWADRMLGQSRMLQLPASTLVAATGNNLRVAGDLCRRVLPIEMDARVEHPELRTFERELVPWAIENRAKLVAAALTILSAYWRAGEPVPPDFAPLGSFEAWSRTVCGALTWLGQPDPRGAMTETRAADPKRLLLGHVLAGMHELFGKEPQSTGSILTAAKLLTPGVHNEHRDRLREAVEEITIKARDERSARIILGKYLDSERGRVVAGLRLASHTDTKTKANAWTAEETEPCG